MDASDVGALTHDLCNDLMVTMGSLEVLAVCPDLSPDAQSLTEAAARAAARASERIHAFQAAHPGLLTAPLPRLVH
jgi:hypothetical protein